MSMFKFLKRKPDGVQPSPQELTPADVKPVKTADGKIFLKVRYNRSYTAKIIQADDRLKSYYGEIRNELMRYGVKARASWRYETFKSGRKLLARLAVRGKTLGLYLALDPADYADTKYKIDDVSSVAKNAEVPVLYKIKNDRRCKYAKDLIAEVMSANGLAAGEQLTVDYCAQYPYEELDTLVGRGLVKLLKWKEKAADSEESLIEISQEEFDEIAADTDVPETVESISVADAEQRLDDKKAESFVRQGERVSDRSRRAIVNIDALGKYFDAGERVTVEEIRRRIPSVDGRATYIKVLARGTLDRALLVEADDFSPAAVKMIILTGGTVTRTRKNGQ